MRKFGPIDVACPSCGAQPKNECSTTRPSSERGRACEMRVAFADSGVGYHASYIKRGEFGEVSKIAEEFHEFMDAVRQDVAIMQFVELSDLLGAVEGWLERHHPTVTLRQLIKMKDVTSRAFANGHRKSR